ncbi:unnamed protein product [Lampetra planeri]
MLTLKMFAVFSTLLLLLLLPLLGHAAAEEEKEEEETALSRDSWRDVLQGEWMLEFYAPWCPACRQLQSEWHKFAQKSKELGINTASVDVTREPGLSGRFFITSLPTIYHVRDGEFRQFSGPRKAADLSRFVSARQWEQVTPVSAWKAPPSILMTGMSWLFQLSMWIRQMHGWLTETLGLPTWGSYVVFGLATLLLGLCLGLVFILLVDLLFQPKRKHLVPSEKEENAFEGQAEDEVERVELGGQGDEIVDNGDSQASDTEDGNIGVQDGDPASSEEEVGELDDGAGDAGATLRMRRPQPGAQGLEEP